MTNTLNNVPRELLENIVLCYNEGEFELGTLAAECHALLSAPSPAGVDGLEVVGWVSDIGSFILSKNGKEAGCNEPFVDADLCRISDAQAIIDGLRGEVEELRAESFESLYNAVIDERDQQAQLIGELEGLLRACHSAMHPFDNMVLEAEIEAALHASKEGER